MSLSRQFLNLIVDHGSPGVRSLCHIDLALHQLFHPSPTPPQQPPNATRSGTQGPPDSTTAAGLTMDSLPIPHPSFTFRSSSPDDEHGKIGCFPLADHSVICADHLGHAFRFDLKTLLAGTLPSLHRPKSTPVSLFVPNAGADTDFTHNSNPLGSSLFFMEKFPKPDLGCGAGAPHSDQFEAFVFRKARPEDYIKAWHCHLLPPPPFVREPEHWRGGGKPPEIGSYGVIGGGGTHVCISVEGVGTYCLDTASHAWRQVGKWTLPFHGRVEYVPELKLWFGFSAETRHLVAADLSAMDSQPQLVGAWEELCLQAEQWKECKDPQFVNLGSGKFYIARFFPTAAAGDLVDGSSSSCKDFAVLTGVEVVPQQVHDGSGGIGKAAELGMVPHKSRRVSGASIEALF